MILLTNDSHADLRVAVDGVAKSVAAAAFAAHTVSAELADFDFDPDANATDDQAFAHAALQRLRLSWTAAAAAVGALTERLAMIRPELMPAPFTDADVARIVHTVDDAEFYAAAAIADAMQVGPFDDGPLCTAHDGKPCGTCAAAGC